jgi:hypothetical protein
LSDSALEKRHGPDETDPFGPLPLGIVPFESRLLSAKHLKDPKLISVLSQQTTSVGGLLLVSGNKAHRPDEENSVNPAWRKAYVHLMGMNMGALFNLKAIQNLTQDSGSYANEVSPSKHLVSSFLFIF